MKRTEISELGEFGLINRIAEQFKVSADEGRILKGIGDDAAVFCIGDKHQVLSTDMLVEGIHFNLAYTPLKHLGYKSVAVNVSDIAAMYCKPLAITVSLALSNRFSVEAIDEFYEGVQAACDDYKISLVGGDTTSSAGGLVISITAIGYNEAKPTLRSGAQPGEVVCVTGDLGGAYLGLQVLARENAVYKVNPDHQPDLSEYEYVVGKQLKPDARMDIIYELMDLKVQPSAMIDVSDGLASEILHLSKASGVSFAVYEKELPMENAARLVAAEFGLVPGTIAMNGGEDYELLFTLPQAEYEKIRHLPDVSAIGITRDKEEANLLITNSGSAVAITAQGWVHF